MHESIWHARIFIVRQRITLQNSNDYLRQIDCLGFAGSVAKRNAGCQDPAHCLSGFLSKAGSFLPGFIFSCAPARNRFALRRRSLLPKAFAPAATWMRLCLRSNRTGGWLYSRYRETSTYPYLFSEETGSALSRGGIWARSLRPLATMGSHLTAGSGWNRASRFAFRMPCRRAASRT